MTTERKPTNLTQVSELPKEGDDVFFVYAPAGTDLIRPMRGTVVFVDHGIRFVTLNFKGLDGKLTSTIAGFKFLYPDFEEARIAALIGIEQRIKSFMKNMEEQRNFVTVMKEGDE